MSRTTRLRHVDCWPSYGLSRQLPPDPELRFAKATLAITELYSRHLALGPPLVCTEWWTRFIDPLGLLPPEYPLRAESGLNGADLAAALMAMPDMRRRQATLDLVQYLLVGWVTAGGWDTSPLQTAYDACVTDGLLLVLTSKAKTSPDRKLSAHVTYTIDGNGDGRSTLHVLDRTGRAVFECEPQESRCEARVFPDLARSLRWEGSNTVRFDPWSMITRRRFFVDKGRQSEMECLADPPITVDNLGYGAEPPGMIDWIAESGLVTPNEGRHF